MRGKGAVPATVAILEGRPLVGLSSEQLEILAKAGPLARKCSRRDLSVAIAQVRGPTNSGGRKARRVIRNVKEESVRGKHMNEEDRDRNKRQTAVGVQRQRPVTRSPWPYRFRVFFSARQEFRAPYKVSCSFSWTCVGVGTLVTVAGINLYVFLARPYTF